MPKFNYTARNGAGATVKGSMEAANAQDLQAKLRRQGLNLQTRRAAGFSFGNMFGKSVKIRDKVIFTRQFSTMINSGLPLLQRIDVLSKQVERPFFQETLRDVVGEVEQGATLADAMRKHPKVFDQLYVSMVQAGESGGILDQILGRLAGFLEKADSLTRKVKGAMVYPVVIFSVAGLCVIVLLIFVIPTFEKMFAEAGAELPGPTKVVIALRQFLKGWWWALIGGGIAAFQAFKKWAATPGGTQALDGFLLKVPVIGDLIKKTAVARFTRTLGTLIKRGVSILDALEITAKTAGNIKISDAVLASRTSIAAGEAIAPPLAKRGLFPPMVISMISVGEQTGGLDEMLRKVADFYDDEVDTAVGSLMSLMEPVMIVVLGVVVGGMIMAMYLPIFNMINTVGE